MMVARIASYASRMCPCNPSRHPPTGQPCHVTGPRTIHTPASSTYVGLPRCKLALCLRISLDEVPDSLDLCQIELAGFECEAGEFACRVGRGAGGVCKDGAVSLAEGQVG